MTDFADALEQELLRAARRHAERRPAVAVLRQGAGLVPALLAVILALAIGIGAISTLREGHRSQTGATTHGRPTVVQRVVGQYAFFRRRQTVADRALFRSRRSRLLPAHTLRALVRQVATVAGHKVFVALTLVRDRVTGYEITVGDRGLSIATFTPFPLRGALPVGEQLGRRAVWLVPDSVTGAVFTDYSGHVITRAPYRNVVSAPVDISNGLTAYTGSRKLATVLAPVARIRLFSPSGTSSGSGEAFISRTTGEGLQADILVKGVRLGRGIRLDLWLYQDPAHKHLLGSKVGAPLWPHNELIGTAALPYNYRAYSDLLVTSHNGQTRPGKILFEGRIKH